MPAPPLLYSKATNLQEKIPFIAYIFHDFTAKMEKYGVKTVILSHVHMKVEIIITNFYPNFYHPNSKNQICYFGTFARKVLPSVIFEPSEYLYQLGSFLDVPLEHRASNGLLDRRHGNTELLCDLGVCKAEYRQSRHLMLPCRQVGSNATLQDNLIDL